VPYIRDGVEGFLSKAQKLDKCNLQGLIGVLGGATQLFLGPTTLDAKNTTESTSMEVSRSQLPGHGGGGGEGRERVGLLRKAVHRSAGGGRAVHLR
jgi:hypothetical protein